MLGLPEEFTPEFIARLEHLRIKTRREYAGLGKGSHLSPRRGSSLEFSDFRHYALGDDFRYIDWVSTAAPTSSISSYSRKKRTSSRTFSLTRAGQWHSRPMTANSKLHAPLRWRSPMRRWPPATA